MNEPIKERDEERLERLTRLAKRIWPEKQNVVVRVERYGRADIPEAFVECEDEDRMDPPILFSTPVHRCSIAALEAALSILAGEAPPWAEQLANAWEAHAGRLTDELADDERAGTLQDCADELRECAKGEP